METKDNINYKADMGKVFMRKADGMVMGYGLGLGKNDIIDNYMEIDCPSEYKNVDGYDNTMPDEFIIN